jgi:Domain of unknown function (DUF6285)
MLDLPRGPTLLALARDVLLNDLMPLLPQEVRLDARLVANSMAIAEREAVAAEAPAAKLAHKLGTLYGRATLTHPTLRAGCPLSHIAGEGAERSEAGEGELGLLARFARDLRVGAFEGSQQHDREAREILWRLAIAKLRLANPRFLAANGFS